MNAPTIAPVAINDVTIRAERVAGDVDSESTIAELMRATMIQVDLPICESALLEAARDVATLSAALNSDDPPESTSVRNTLWSIERRMRAFAELARRVRLADQSR